MLPDYPLLDVRLLRSFVAVAEYKHFGKAAKAVHATQPGVSQHISKLEATLQVKLINRTKRSVELTPAGETALKHARTALFQLKKMVEESQSTAAGYRGQLGVGLSSSMIFTDIPARLGEYWKQHPDLEINLVFQRGDQLKPLLEVGEIDVVFTTLPMPDDEYTSTVVSWQEMAVALPQSHPLSHQDQVTLAELHGERFIVVPREQHPFNHDALLAGFHAMGKSLHISCYETSFHNMLMRVALGQGVAIVAKAYEAERPGAVQVISLKDPDLAWTPVYLAAKRASTSAPAHRLVETFSVGWPQTRPTESQAATMPER